MTLQKQLERIAKNQKRDASSMHVAVLSQIHETKTEFVATNGIELLRVFARIENPRQVQYYPNYNHVINDVSDTVTSEVSTRILKVALKPLKSHIGKNKKRSIPYVTADISITDNHVVIRSEDTAQILFEFDVTNSPDIDHRLYDASNLVHILEIMSEQQRSHESVQFGLKCTRNAGFLRAHNNKFEYISGSLRKL